MKTSLWFLCLALGLSSASLAQPCQQLSASGVSQYPPYVWHSSQDPSRLIGAMASLTQHLGQDLGIELSMAYQGPWARVQQQQAKGNIDLVAGIFRTSQREQVMDFLSPPMFYSNSRVWVNKRSKVKIAQLSDLVGLAGVGVIDYNVGETFETYAKEHLNITRVNDIRQAVLMLENNRVDYFVHEEIPANTYFTYYQSQDIEQLPLLLSREGIYLTLAKKSKCNTPEFKQQLEHWLQHAEQQGWAQQYLKEAQEIWLKNHHRSALKSKL